MPERPSLDEIETTIARLEARLGKSQNPETARLLAACRKLDARFRADLADPRDLALSRGATLMLVKFIDDLEKG